MEAGVRPCQQPPRPRPRQRYAPDRNYHGRPEQAPASAPTDTRQPSATTKTPTSSGSPHTPPRSPRNPTRWAAAVPRLTRPAIGPQLGRGWPQQYTAKQIPKAPAQQPKTSTPASAQNTTTTTAHNTDHQPAHHHTTKRHHHRKRLHRKRRHQRQEHPHRPTKPRPARTSTTNETSRKALTHQGTKKRKGHPKQGDPLPQKLSGGVLLSHTVPSAVPSALEGLTSGFGM